MERPSEVRAESGDNMSTEKSTGKRDHLRVVKNPKESSNGDGFSWKFVVLTSAISATVGFVAVELVKLGAGKVKKVANMGQEKQPNPPSQLPGMVMPPGMNPEQQAMFQSPYAQMAMMRGGFMPTSSSTFPNPLIPEEEDDEPPKWFRRFKDEHDKELSELKRAVRGPSAADLDDFEEDE